MGVTVTFDYAKWVARYPEFVNVADATAQLYFTEATIYHTNRGVGSGPSDPAVQLMLLNMLTAHIAARYALPSGQAQPADGIVGRITSASEGSVSVQAEYAKDVTINQAWYMTTKYGTDYWNATRPYRTMRYRPGAAAFGQRGAPRGFGWRR